VLLALGITFTIGWAPVVGPKARPLTERRFEVTPERIERGRYLANAVLGCLDCHSERHMNLPGGPPVPGKEGTGKVFLDRAQGFPGRLVAANITPDQETGVGAWSDDMLARVIREGIGHDGRALFPVMPYVEYSVLPDEDLAAVIVYLRSLPGVRNQLPKTEIDFPVNRFINSVPQPITSPVAQPDLSDPVKRGAHLARISGCTTCHTPLENQQPKAGFELAGGQVFGDVAATNITPDPSGISYYDEGLFFEVLRTGQVKARKLSPEMPWFFYKGMTDEDIKSIFAYLRTARPVKHRVDNAEPVTDCKLCGGKHGAGAQN
jgi:mono/diheme cytochrome c family protein